MLPRAQVKGYARVKGESSMASYGVPRGLWLEAREFRKLARGGAKTSD